MQKSDTTNSQFTERRMRRLATQFIHGENWKKLAQLKSKPTNQQDLDESQFNPPEMDGNSNIKE